jgi:hypothetical protein
MGSSSARQSILSGFEVAQTKGGRLACQRRACKRRGDVNCLAIRFAAVFQPNLAVQTIAGCRRHRFEAVNKSSATGSARSLSKHKSSSGPPGRDSSDRTAGRQSRFAELQRFALTWLDGWRENISANPQFIRNGIDCPLDRGLCPVGRQNLNRIRVL